MTEKTENSLIPLDDNRALRAFKDPEGLEPLLAAIEIECRAAPVVLNTENGRKNIASLAYKVAQTKNQLDKIGKGLTEDARKFIGEINDSRARAWERLESLQKEIRAPLDEWEEKEKARIKGHEAALAAMQALAVFPAELPPPSSADIKARIETLRAGRAEPWQEYETRAARFASETLQALNAALQAAEQREAEEKAAAEWDSMYQAAIQENREFDIARAAAKAARELAEKKARKEAEAAAAEAAINLVWEQAHRENAEFDARKAQEKAEAEESAKWAAIYAAADTENAAFDAAKRAAEFARQESERAAAKAAQDERDRQAAEEKRKADEDAKRAADQENRQKINGAATDAIADILVDIEGAQDLAFEIVTAISKGEIPHVAIKY